MSDTHDLADLLAPGLAPADIPALNALMGARGLLSAFITLFRGGEDEVLLRILVLREIGLRAAAPRWSSQELLNHFAYLNATKLETVLKRFSKDGLLVWDSDDQLYSLSTTGRVVLAAISSLTQFAEEDAELGYLTAQVAAGQAVGDVAPDALQHLLARLNELHADFEAALESQSEFQIKAARKQLDSVWRWVEKGTEIIRSVLEDEHTGYAEHQVAQAIALAQARMLRLTSVFHRRLNELAAQRVHLGESGLTSSNIADWLRSQSQDTLANLGRDLLTFHPEPSCVVSDILLDITEFELLERERDSSEIMALPASQAAQEAGEVEVEQLLAADAFYSELQGIAAEVNISEAVLADTYEETVYRLSLLSLLGDAEVALENSVVADIVRLPFALELDASVEILDHPAVAAMTRGRLRPLMPANTGDDHGIA